MIQNKTKIVMNAFPKMPPNRDTGRLRKKIFEVSLG